MSIDYSALKTEIQRSVYAGMQDGSIADQLNSLSGPDAATITLSTIPKNTFLLGILAPAALVLPSKDSSTQAKWDRLYRIAEAAESFDVNSSTIQALFSQAISDGILTQNQVDAVATRVGSRSEVLFGQGVSVSNLDVAQARKS